VPEIINPYVGIMYAGLSWHTVPSDANVLNKILDSAMLRRDATVEDALRTASWRSARKTRMPYVNPLSQDTSSSPSPTEFFTPTSSSSSRRSNQARSRAWELRRATVPLDSQPLEGPTSPLNDSEFDLINSGIGGISSLLEES
jgi:hypothetical protein